MSVEAHTTLYLALSIAFINDWYNRSLGNKHKIENLQECLLDDLKEHADGLKKIFIIIIIIIIIIITISLFKVDRIVKYW